MSVVTATARAILSLEVTQCLDQPCLFKAAELSPVEVRFDVPLIDGLLILEILSDPHLDLFPAELPSGPQPLMTVNHNIVARDLDGNVQAFAQALLQFLELRLVEVGKEFRLPRVALQIFETPEFDSLFRHRSLSFVRSRDAILLLAGLAV
jgi:hypothetical protein